MTRHRLITRRLGLSGGLAALPLLLATLAGCVPSAPSGQLRSAAAPPSGVIKQSDGDLTFFILPYTVAMEKAAFGVNLHTKRELAIEVRVDQSADAVREAVLRRQDVQLVFADGTRRYPVDPIKLYENHRIDTTSAGVAFGMLGAAIASSQDQNLQHSFTKAGLSEAHLTGTNRSVTTFLFFDLNGMTNPQPTELVIEYEQLPASDVRSVEIKL